MSHQTRERGGEGGIPSLRKLRSIRHYGHLRQIRSRYTPRKIPQQKDPQKNRRKKLTDLCTCGIIDIMKRCFECEKTEDQIEIHEHHVIPKSCGGTKTIPLCCVCHAIVHDKRAVSISELTKAGLKSAKDRGVRLGNPKWQEGIEKARNSRFKDKEEWEKKVKMVIQSLDRGEKESYNAISKRLNEIGFKSYRGSKWYAQTVKRLLEAKN